MNRDIYTAPLERLQQLADHMSAVDALIEFLPSLPPLDYLPAPERQAQKRQLRILRQISRLLHDQFIAIYERIAPPIAPPIAEVH